MTLKAELPVFPEGGIYPPWAEKPKYPPLADKFWQIPPPLEILVIPVACSIYNFVLLNLIPFIYFIYNTYMSI